MLQNLFYALLLLAGFPTAWILIKLCRDEIKNWKNRFILIAGISLLLAVTLSFIRFEYKIPVIITLFFIIITSLTIVWESH